MSGSKPRSAIVTVAMGQAAGHLDNTFSSFAINAGIPLHAFILQEKLPERRLEGIQYHLVPPIPDFSHPLREVYFRRHELIDRLDAEMVLVVDSYDVLCLQPLPAFEDILGNADVAACVEHVGCRYLEGQGYTSSFLNGGVFFWRTQTSRDIRLEITARGRDQFRTVADDQLCLNEVIQTRHYQRLRILPCQYNFRAYLNRHQRGWPTVNHLDGVMMYHNATCMDEAKRLLPVKAKAELPVLMKDKGPLTPREQFWRRVRQRMRPHIVK